MFFKHFYDPDLAQGSFLVGCQVTGEAVVVDARRDVDVYLREAEAQGLTITDVTETHIHADYLSGSRELAERTGARLWLSDMGDEDWKYRFDGRPLVDGDEIRVGNIVLRAVHTPGHTPEHLSFLVIDGATTDQPQMILTGDFVFVGDIGRPDLLDEAAGGVDTRFVGAKQLFASLRDRFLTLPDYVQVWPAHGAGSACGKSLGAVPASTVGYERTTAWWADYVANDDEAGFTEALLEGQPDAPLYFGRMKRWNKEGPAVLGERTEPVELDAAATARRLNDREILFLDTRTMAEWHADAIDGALFVPFGNNFATYASYAIDPERDTQEIVVLAADAEQAKVMRDKLSWTGVDNFGGFVTDLAPFEREPIEILTPEELDEAQDTAVLDVRTASEYEAGHIDDALRIHAGRLRWKLDELPENVRIVAHCQTGGRSAVAASILRRHGVANVAELQNSYEGWLAYRRPQDAAPA
jgi:hydroxyacylglutathione hydrolase